MKIPLLFRLIVRGQAKVYGGAADNGAFSLENACPRCGSGAVRIEPVRVPGGSIPKSDIFITLNMEYMVGARVARLIRSKGIRCLREVRDIETDQKLLVDELVPEAVLPPFSAATAGFEHTRSCPVCNRDGYFDVPRVRSHIVYDLLDSSYRQYDLLATYELFGFSRLRPKITDSVFAKPLFIVSGRLANILRPLGGVELWPIEMRKAINS